MAGGKERIKTRKEERRREEKRREREEKRREKKRKERKEKKRKKQEITPLSQRHNFFFFEPNHTNNKNNK